MRTTMSSRDKARSSASPCPTGMAITNRAERRPAVKSSDRPYIPPELRPTNQRIEAFSDAVFAIVVTIMILEIRIPDQLAFGNDPGALMELTAVVATYALSFVVIAI